VDKRKAVGAGVRDMEGKEVGDGKCNVSKKQRAKGKGVLAAAHYLRIE
jgi:hypothetical protein